jgi:hypothetical protein
MALPITVPYTFGNATTAIPLSNLDSDYATVYQAVNGIGNGSVALANVAITGGTISGNTTASNVTVSSGTFTNVTLSNVTISSVSTPITAAEGGTGSSSAFTSGGVVYASSTSALATGSALTFDGSNLGVGTNSPLATLDVSAAAARIRLASSTGTNNALLSFTNTGGTSYVGLDNSAAGLTAAYALNLYQSGAYPITFSTNSAERMRIDSSGNVGIGTSSPISNSGYGGLSLNGTSGALFSMMNAGTESSRIASVGNETSIQSKATTGFITFVQGVSGGTERARIDSSGNLLIGYTSSNGAYKLQVNSQIFATSAIIATSDARYKTNVTPISNGLALINKLNPVSFDWKEHSVHDFDTKNTNVGFLAQDVQEVLKNEIYLNSVIRKNETELPDGTKEEFLGLSDSSLIPILVKAIQELTTRLTVLENK